MTDAALLLYADGRVEDGADAVFLHAFAARLRELIDQVASYELEVEEQIGRVRDTERERDELRALLTEARKAIRDLVDQYCDSAHTYVELSGRISQALGRRFVSRTDAKLRAVLTKARFYVLQCARHDTKMGACQMCQSQLRCDPSCERIALLAELTSALNNGEPPAEKI